VGVIGGKEIEQAVEISGCQIAFGRRAGVKYNIHGYGILESVISPNSRVRFDFPNL
jgi:hypothetical protein